MARNQKKDDDWKGWAIIVLLFAFRLWPVALVVLFGKLFASDKKQEAPPPLRVDAETHDKNYNRRQNQNQSQNKKTSARNFAGRKTVNRIIALVLEIVGGLLAVAGIINLGDPIGALFWSSDWVGLWLKEFWNCLSMTFVGVTMLLWGISIDRTQKRFGRYLVVMGEREAIAIEELARVLDYTPERVEKDLQKMIDKGYFGGRAYLNMELGYFFRSNEADARVARERTEAQNRRKAETAQATENEYDRILRDIRRANDEIADPVLSAKIQRLEDVTAGIFQAVQADPAKRSRIDTFLNYYLPTTQKLLDSYARFEATGVEGENLRQAKARIEKTMDSIVAGFEHQLDQLYKDDAMDVDSDIRVMETMLHRDTATVEQDFGLGGTAVQREEE